MLYRYPGIDCFHSCENGHQREYQGEVNTVDQAIHPLTSVFNPKKLRDKLDANPADNTLFKMVRGEIGAKKTTASGSGTDALLWLKRALSFIRAFIREVLTLSLIHI